MAPHSGDQYLICFTAGEGNNFVQNDDWLISPAT